MKGFSFDSLKVQFTLTFHTEQFQPFRAHPTSLSFIQSSSNLTQFHLELIQPHLVSFILIITHFNCFISCVLFKSDFVANSHHFISCQLANLISSIYKFVCLSVCLSVCLYPINVKTAEPIGPKYFVGHHVTPGKVYG